MTKHLFLDVSNLAYRAFHTTGTFSYEGIRTGVLFGIFRDIIYLSDRFNPDMIGFFFDARGRKRQEIFPEYKQNRKPVEESDDMREARMELYEQLDHLANRYLPSIGYQGIYKEEGYEADDLIASGCEDLGVTDLAVIVSSDQDLFQLLQDGRVSIWNPVQKKLITENTFVDKFGIGPEWWDDVKAIAGCSSDGVPGVPGVGEKTAIKYLNGELKSSFKAFQNISGAYHLIERNRGLVSLPLVGCPEVRLRGGVPDEAEWDAIMTELGIDVLKGMRVTR